MKGLKDTYIHTLGREKWLGKGGGKTQLAKYISAGEVGLSVCFLWEANKEHILRFPGYCVRIRDTAVSRQT